MILRRCENHKPDRAHPYNKPNILRYHTTTLKTKSVKTQILPQLVKIVDYLYISITVTAHNQPF